jgi:tRNA threonylcarbamoyl adenosine modification protein YjeE
MMTRKETVKKMPWPKSISLPDLSALFVFAEKIASHLKPRDILLLYGDLGAGKTTLARAIIQSLNPALHDIPSPTFTLVQNYDTPCGPVYHYDLYRLKHHDELTELGFDEACATGMVLVEWPEHMGPRLPARVKSIHLSIKPHGEERVAQCEGTWPL